MSSLWSDSKWKKSMAGGGGNRKYISIVLILQEQLCISELFKDIQEAILLILHDNVIIQSNFFQYIYHVGCAINLHSIINSGWIFGGQNLNNRQTVFFLLVSPRDKSHKDLDTIDLSESRHAQSIENTSGRSILGRHQSCYKERIEVLSDEIERNHSSWNISSFIVFRKLSGWKLEKSQT